uniref:Uncharacterized protein n=1 Tax=Cannabis sativa TaxID=3483 RepID=A0A803P4X3_CANSA
MVNTQKNISKKTPLDIVMEEADSLASEFDDDHLVEVMTEEHDHRQTEVETSNAYKDKGKGKVDELPQKSAPKPPQKDTNLAGEPSRTQKATDAFKPGRSSDPRGKAVPNRKSTRVPKKMGEGTT